MKLGRFSACVLVLCAQRHAGAFQDWSAAIQGGLVKGPVLGLLNLPEIAAGECAPAALASLRAYRGPSTSSPVVGVLERIECRVVVRRVEQATAEDLPTTESDYEYPAAVVLQRNGLWFRIALQRGSAWVERAHATDFHSYPALLDGRLAYLRPSWDGLLSDTPDGSRSGPVPAGWRPSLTGEIPIVYLGSRRVGSRTWLHVRLDRSAGCGDVPDGVSPDGVEPLTGWIPAFTASAEPSAWFYSRGC